MKLSHIHISFFKNKRFCAVWFPFNRKECFVCDMDLGNFFYWGEPLFKLLRYAKNYNKHYGHVRNRPININADYKK